MSDTKRPTRRLRWWNRPIRNRDISRAARITYRQGKKIVILVIGMTVLLIGIAGLILPILPGWVLIFVGLAILAIEFAWARRWLKKLKKTANDSLDYVKGKVGGPTNPDAPTRAK